MDPRRATRWRHPAVRLYGEYIWAFIAAIRRAPLSDADRHECYRYLAHWLASRTRPGGSSPQVHAPSPGPATIPVNDLVAGQERKAKNGC